LFEGELSNLQLIIHGWWLLVLLCGVDVEWLPTFVASPVAREHCRTSVLPWKRSSGQMQTA
jgi:hypothetical protein